MQCQPSVEKLHHQGNMVKAGLRSMSQEKNRRSTGIEAMDKQNDAE
jgi:hypothetical protein